MNTKYTRTKYACYAANISMSVVANLPPILFLTFRNMYGISYSLLGLLILVNFCTQLAVDLIFSFFSHKINMIKAVKLMPVLTLTGLLIYAAAPVIFSGNVYLGLLIGTIVFSSSGGFAEVLISPVIAAIPSKNPEREMSKLHSFYAWGVVFTIAICTVFILLSGTENWQILVMIFTLIPLSSSILFAGAKIPDISSDEKTSNIGKLLKNSGVWLCVAAIFFGGAAECTMSQWSSSYIEKALGIPKVWGDIFGVALFAVMLGLGRSLYAKYGKKICNVLIAGVIGATLCYLVAAITNIALVGLFACAFTGFCTSMLWPGSLIVASGKYEYSGVFIYALMASGGDLGASVAPQLVGVVTDAAMNIPKISLLANNLGITSEQMAMKIGMLVAMLFPLVAIPVFLRLRKFHNKNNEI